MATTPKQDKQFIEELISATLLEEAIAWIADNMSPEEVFSQTQMEDWAERMGFEQGKE